MRGLECELSLLNKADGSATFQHGDTKVLCAVYGPAEVKANREIIDKATLECILKLNSGISGVKEKSIENIVSKTCEEILLLSSHPRSAIQIVLQIMQDEGSILSVLINCACMAMVHCGLPMKNMVAAISCIMPEDSDEIILDPTKQQEEDARCAMSFAFNCSNFEMITSHTRGTFTIDEFFNCVNICRENIREIIHFQRESISRFLSKEANAADDVTEDENESEVTGEEEMDE